MKKVYATTCFHSRLVNFSNADTLTWRRVKAKGDVPPNRYEHGSCIIGNEGEEKLLIMYGAGKEAPLEDIWSFDLCMRY